MTLDNAHASDILVSLPHSVSIVLDETTVTSYLSARGEGAALSFAGANGTFDKVPEDGGKRLLELELAQLSVKTTKEQVVVEDGNENAVTTDSNVLEPVTTKLHARFEPSARVMRPGPFAIFALFLFLRTFLLCYVPDVRFEFVPTLCLDVESAQLATLIDLGREYREMLVGHKGVRCCN